MSKICTVLIFCHYYYPSYKSGGPVRSVYNLTEQLGDEFEFKVVASDRDSQDIKSFEGINVDAWNRVGKADVYYCSPKNQTLNLFCKLLAKTHYDVLYLNSFFSPYSTIKPLLLRRLGLIPRKPVVVAPRGEFSQGALGLKSLKKRVYLQLAKVVGFYSGVIWQASSAYEETDIRQWFGNNVPVVVAPNIASSVSLTDEFLPKSKKTQGYLNIIFLSRISRQKNLNSALNMLHGLRGKIQFDIYGPISDKKYWIECEQIISNLPRNINVKYCGIVTHDRVMDVIREYDLFFLPTLGENFGHVILEAISAGTPVLISDKTPWRNLQEKSAGWDLSLMDISTYVAVIERCVAMDELEHKSLRAGARKLAQSILEDKSIIQANRQLFSDARD